MIAVSPSDEASNHDNTTLRVVSLLMPPVVQVAIFSCSLFLHVAGVTSNVLPLLSAGPCTVCH